MIDLRKPLEGVPGLLLMAALIFFGATIGIAAALAASWVELKDSIANFLGGVVGAGLGSLGGVLGAVYVFRLSRKAQLAKPFGALLLKVQDAQVSVGVLRQVAKYEGPEVTQDGQRRLPVLAQQFVQVRKDFQEIRPDPELPQEVNAKVLGLEIFAEMRLRAAEANLRGGPKMGETLEPDEVRLAHALAHIDRLIKDVEILVGVIEKELPH